MKRPLSAGPGQQPVDSRESPLLLMPPPPPAGAGVRLYPDLVPPGSVPSQGNPPIGGNAGGPPHLAGQHQCCPPPSYCEPLSACHQQSAGGGGGCRQSAGVRYYVHGAPQLGQIHAVHPVPVGAPLCGSGESVFYYVSSSSSACAASNPGNPFWLVRRRRKLSYASFVLFCILASVFLMVFLKMHTDLSRKYFQQQPTQLLAGENGRAVVQVGVGTQPQQQPPPPNMPPPHYANGTINSPPHAPIIMLVANVTGRPANETNSQGPTTTTTTQGGIKPMQKSNVTHDQ